MSANAKETPTTVLIADYHGVLRAGLRALFARYPYLKVVGEAAGGNEAIRLAHTLAPDLVLLDINMPELDGIAVTEALKRALPATRVLVLTAATDVELLRRALRAGACGYVVKSASESELMSAIEAVLRGELYLDPTVIRALLTGAAPPIQPSPEAGRLGSLTNRERDVMHLLAVGYTNREVARDLGVSVRTVETHRATLTHKLGTRNRADMLRLVNEYDLIRTAELRQTSQ